MSKELKDAISRNDVRKLQQIFCSSNVKLNDCVGYNPLIHACVKGSAVIAGALVKAGADVNVRSLVRNIRYFNQYSCTSDVSDKLWAAIKREGIDTVTPLILGVVDRNLELVRKLLQDCGADVNATNEVGTAPLHCISSNATERESPARVDIQQEIADLLLKAGADPNLQDRSGTTPLHCAATKGDLDYSRKLLQNGADTNLQDGSGTTPLHCVATVGDLDHSRKLLQNGARVDLADNKGITALHIAACRADRQLLELLIQHEGSQAYVNQKTHDDATPLHVAITSYQAAHERIAVVRLLVDNGADLTSQNHGLTPLHLAAEAGYLDIVKMLVEAGADIFTEAPFTCLTPVDMAKHTKKQAVVDYLVAKAAESENDKGGRPKRDAPSVEQEDNGASQQTDTPVEENLVEGAVGGFQQVLVIKDEDSTDKK